jgi:tetrahydromethanopterin S-methyltransferase subunit F
MTERNLAIRLTVLDGGKVKAELREIGDSGEKSLKKIELAGKPASKSLLALNAAANDVKGSVTGLTGRLGPLGSALAAIGPAGLAIGAALAVVTLGLVKSIGACPQPAPGRAESDGQRLRPHGAADRRRRRRY